MWEKCSDELSNYVNQNTEEKKKKGKGWSLSQHMSLSGYGKKKEGLLISVTFLCLSYMF